MTGDLSLASLVQRIAREPSPDILWQMQPLLLALDSPAAEAARELAGQFYVYLSHVRSKLTSKDFSALAAKLAAGAVGVISLQEFVESLADNHRKALTSLLGGGLASSLEMLSTFQHVKAWEMEFASEHDAAVWQIYAALWRVSAETQPDLPTDERAAHIKRLLAPVRDAQVSSAARLALVISLFQILLVIRLVPLLTAEAYPQGAK